jgi:hypothetical protein
MHYDAITFDTQTVETNSFHFGGGLLSQLKQFKDGPVRVVVSEMVVREIFKHLVEKTRQETQLLPLTRKLSTMVSQLQKNRLSPNPWISGHSHVLV